VTVLRDRRGNAYLFVVVAVLVITLLAGAALAVTASSRRASMYYIEFAGLYELAVAGNEQALFALRDLVGVGVASPAAMDITAMPAWQTIDAGAVYRTWQAAVPDAVFVGRTTVTYAPLRERWQVYTRIFCADAAHLPVVVQAYIVPTLDGNSLRMINSMRITN